MAEPFKGRVWAANLPVWQVAAYQPSWVKVTYRNPHGLHLGFETQADMNKYKESVK